MQRPNGIQAEFILLRLSLPVVEFILPSQLFLMVEEVGLSPG